MQAMVSGMSLLNDYDYNKPDANLFGENVHLYPFEHGSELVYDYPGGYDDKGPWRPPGGGKARRRRTHAERCSAGGYAPSLTPGYTIKRTSPDGDSQDDDLLDPGLQPLVRRSVLCLVRLGRRAAPTRPIPGRTSFPRVRFPTACPCARAVR